MGDTGKNKNKDTRKNSGDGYLQHSGVEINHRRNPAGRITSGKPTGKPPKSK